MMAKVMVKVCGIPLLTACLLLGQNARAEDAWQIPAVNAENKLQSLQQADQFAWRLFVALNWPADLAKREADGQQSLASQAPAVWETWPRTELVYLPLAAEPLAWDALKVGTDHRIKAGENDSDQLQSLIDLRGVPLTKDNFAQYEVRYNRLTHDYIRSSRLYDASIQEYYFYHDMPIRFPDGAIIIKAVWRLIPEDHKAYYRWSEFTQEDGSTQLLGLTGMHIMAKYSTGWHWSTFEHVDNPYRTGIMDEGWMLPSVDAFACPQRPRGCNDAPKDFGLENTPFNYYRLRGAMVDYIDELGNPLLIANSQIETGQQASSSCMGCHTRASIGPRISTFREKLFADAKAAQDFQKTGQIDNQHSQSRLPLFKSQPDGSLIGYFGAPQAGSFALSQVFPGVPGDFARMDYVWSLGDAQSSKISVDPAPTAPAKAP
ncbi:MAG: hypothetical protein ABWY06_04510 [Pseudomonas sp.]|uniref:hypothetical protein n=1 Tax=Pseudomonas sp. TaxID=306 RepID=UPI003395AD4A